MLISVPRRFVAIMDIQKYHRESRLMVMYKELPHHHNENMDMQKLQETVNQNNYFQFTANIFKQVGDPTRLKIFWILCHCEECVINLAALIDMSSPAVSHHLRPLKAAGLIDSHRKGKEVYYRAADTPQSRSLHLMIEQMMNITCPQ